MSDDDLDLAVGLSHTPSEVIRIINAEEIRKFKLGVFFLVVAIASWIFGLELLNAVLKGDEYQKPWTLAYVTGSCFTLNLIPDIFGSKQKQKRSPDELDNLQSAKLALVIAVIYYFYNLFVMLALQYTSASNQTVLSSTTSIFTLFIGIMLGIERFSIQKLFCIVISFCGVLLISWSDAGLSNDSGNKFVPKNPNLGNALAVLGALMYALYMIVMKVRCGTGTHTVNERRLFGFVGAFTLIIGIPVLYLLHILGIEHFELPPKNPAIILLILINGVFSVISDYTTILAMLLTSPLVTSLSLSSSIPITIFIDEIIMRVTGAPSSDSGHFMYYSGIASILLSVLLINVNLTTENQLILEVIDDALEDAIQEDEVLSPVLTPLLSPQAQYARTTSYKDSPKLQIGIRSPLALRSQALHLPPTRRTISAFDLNRDTEDTDEQEQEDMHFTVTGGVNHRYKVRIHQPSESSPLLPHNA